MTEAQLEVAVVPAKGVLLRRSWQQHPLNFLMVFGLGTYSFFNSALNRMQDAEWQLPQGIATRTMPERSISKSKTLYRHDANRSLVTQAAARLPDPDERHAALSRPGPCRNPAPAAVAARKSTVRSQCALPLPTTMNVGQSGVGC